MASKIMDFTYIGKLPNLWICLPGQSKITIVAFIASSKAKQMLARVGKIVDFAYLGKLPDL